MNTSAALVTGGAGFIGAAISSSLADRFDRVIAVDNFLSQVHPEGKPADGFDSRVEIYQGDITNPSMWDSLLADVKPHVVIHLAAETGTGQSLTESSRHTKVNVTGTSVMLDALHRNNTIPERILLASSRAVYGEGAWRRNNGDIYYPGLRTTAMLTAHQWDFRDSEPLPMCAATTERRPTSIYGVTKSAQEDLLKLWGDAFGVQIGILRLQNVYGPGQTPGNPYTGIMSLFCRLASEGKTIPLYEDGQVRRDFIIIDDIVDAIVRALETSMLPSLPLDIGSGNYTTINEAARIIASIYNAPKPEVTKQWRHGDVRHAWADPQPAQELLGFTAKITPEEGLSRLASWITPSRHL